MTYILCGVGLIAVGLGIGLVAIGTVLELGIKDMVEVGFAVLVTVPALFFIVLGVAVLLEEVK